MIPTVKVIKPGSRLGYHIANEADFDAETQALWEEETQEVTPESIAKMPKVAVLDLLTMHGCKVDGRASVKDLRAMLTRVMFMEV